MLLSLFRQKTYEVLPPLAEPSELVLLVLSGSGSGAHLIPELGL